MNCIIHWERFQEQLSWWQDDHKVQFPLLPKMLDNIKNSELLCHHENWLHVTECKLDDCKCNYIFNLKALGVFYEKDCLVETWKTINMKAFSIKVYMLGNKKMLYLHIIYFILISVLNTISEKIYL